MLTQLNPDIEKVNGNNKNFEISPMFMRVLKEELKEIIRRTQGEEDKKVYKDLLNKIENDGISSLLKKGPFSIEDIQREYEKLNNDGSKMPIKENLSDIIIYLKAQFKNQDSDDIKIKDDKSKVA